MEFVLIRHFESLGNAQRQNYNLHGDGGVPLSEKGIAQAPETAAALDALLKKHGITRPEEVAIMCSPYTRAQQTLQLIQQHSTNPAVQQGKPQTQEWLREMNVGDAMDLTKAEQFALYPANMAEYNRRLAESPSSWHYLYGEKPLDRYQAVQQVDIPAQMQALKAKGVKLVIGVSHQINISTIRAVLRGEEPDEIMRGPRLNNGGILSMTMDEQGKFSKPDLHHGRYKPYNLAKIIETTPSAMPLNQICPIKRINHTLKMERQPEGLYFPEPSPNLPELQIKSPVTSFFEQEQKRREGQPGPSKNSLPGKG